MRRRPSELKVSTGFVAPPTKTPPPAVETGTAATVKPLPAALCPKVTPDVPIARRPRLLLRCNARVAAPVLRKITMRFPAKKTGDIALLGIFSKGSWLPLCELVEEE